MQDMKPTAGLSRWIAWLCYTSVLLFGAYMLLDVLFFAVFYTRSHQADVHFSGTMVMAVRAAVWLTPKLTVLLLAVCLATAVLSLVWLYRSRINLDVLNVTGLNHSPGWCVGWWFIPFANLVMPYRVMGEIDGGSRWRQHWASHGTAGLVSLWWLAYIVSSLLLRGSQVLAQHDQGLMLVALGMDLVARALGIVAALCLARLVLRVHEAQFESPAQRDAPVEPALPEPA